MYIPIGIIVILVAAVFALAVYTVFLRGRAKLYRIMIDDYMHKNSEVNNFLSLFSMNLKSSERITDSMNTTAQYVADLVEAEAVCIFFREGEYLRAVGVSGAFPPLHMTTQYVLTKPRYILESLRREKIKMGEGIIGQVAQTKDALFIEDAISDSRLADIDTAVPVYTLMAIPLKEKLDGDVIGVICAVNNRNQDMPFSAEQFSRLKFISSQVVLAHNIVQVYSSMSEQQRINQELEFARQLQASLLPESFPAWDQFLVHSFTRSAKEVSGDFYDFVEIDEDRLLVVVGDACGKGIPACMVMAMTRSFIRSNIERFTTLKDMLMELNDNLFRDTDEERFITLGCCLLDKKQSVIEYARAGHTEVIMHVHEHLRAIHPSGAAMGLLPSDLSDLDTFSFQFVPDMSILLFTDGITEAINDRGMEYGNDRLKDVFNKSCLDNDPPEKTIDKILQSIDDFTGNTELQADDQTMVIIKHL